jgi:2-desacetyl-2-hydroxyethyl bacteriochlorophyllide A dehydrogenase
VHGVEKMQAEALICDEHQNFSLEKVILRDPNPDQIAIRTHYTGVSIGTEFALIRNKLYWGPYPLCTGYQGTGTVEAIGENVTNFHVGDQVYFRRNDYMKLPGGQRVSCVSGTHCSHIVLNPNTSHGAAKVPPDAKLDVTAMFVMPAVGLNGVDMANPRMGTTVVVYGVGLIGLGVVAACAHRGCVVIAADINRKRLEIARKMGADYTIDGSEQDVPTEVRKIAPEGADTVFECTGIPECIDLAIEICRTHGSFVWQGNYGESPVSIKFLPAHGRRLKMFFPCDDGLQPCRRAVVKNMAMGVLKWDNCITHRIEYLEAPAIFDRINRGEKGILGVVIRWIE